MTAEMSKWCGLETEAEEKLKVAQADESLHLAL